MRTKTTHIVPLNGGWAVKKEGSADRDSVVHSTQRAAMEVARGMAQRVTSSQIVIHRRDGSIRLRDIHGLPAVQVPRRKSDLGTKAIEKAVSTVIRQRLFKVKR
ncbi:MAG TPA: DUF2188 domain-containing protein [Bryobacteraceae bacterium]|nr:DUF2188 domain-containing protein [Bryobacteraceae bacterium]